MFSREEIDFLLTEANAARHIAEAYQIRIPEVAETCKRKAVILQTIAEKIDRLVSAIELR